MKVIFLSKRYWPAVGGVERHQQFLCEALQKLRPDIELTIITEQHDSSLPEAETVNGVEILRIPLLPSPASPDLKQSVWQWMEAHRELLFQADILHVHDVFFWLQPLLPIMSPRVFTTFHGYEPPSPSWKQRLNHQFAELLSDGSIGIGGFHQKWYGVDPTLTSFGAVDTAHESNKKIIQNGRLIFVGRLEDETGIWAYASALAQLKRKSKLELKLDVVGDGPLRAQLERFVENEELPVRFLGWKKVTTTLYQEYDLSLVSRYLSILESLAAGVPILSTFTTPIMRDYLQLSPFADWITIQPPGQSLEVALQTQHRLSYEAQTWAKDQTWEAMAKLYLRLWTQKL